MGQRHTLTKRCIEHSFIFVHFDLNADWLKPDLVYSHTPTLSCRGRSCACPAGLATLSGGQIMPWVALTAALLDRKRQEQMCLFLLPRSIQGVRGYCTTI